MPEGHTIHRLALDQKKTIGGKTLQITSPQGRFTEEAEQLNGFVLKKIEAVGKHLFYHFIPSQMLHVHLGLFGKYRTHKNPPPPPRGAVRVRFEGQTHTVDLNGPNQCELLTRVQYKSIRDRLGPDPLNKTAKPQRAWEKIHRSRAPIGLLLMDQSIISGIGNIYRTEILHLTRIHPRIPGDQITRKQFDLIWKKAVELLNVGVKFNRIITVDLKTVKGDPLKIPRSKLFRIFKKTECPDCGGEIERFTQAGRKVFACTHCQPPTIR